MIGIAIGSLIEKRRIHLSILNQTFIAIPPPKEQEIIGERLKTWDKAITQAEKLIEAKQKLKKGLMQQLLTGRRRFLEFGLPVTESKQVPLGWQEVKIGEIFKRVNRKTALGSHEFLRHLESTALLIRGTSSIVLSLASLSMIIFMSRKGSTLLIGVLCRDILMER